MSAREFFSEGKDITIRDYMTQNEVMRDVLGLPQAGIRMVDDE